MCIASRSKFVARYISAIAVLCSLCCLGGCGEPSSPDTPSVENEVAVEPAYVSRPVGSLTYSRDIAPVIIENCAPCHRPGEAGPFSLLSYQDVLKRAQQLVEVTSDRYMPPWLPQHGYGSFAGERRLTNDEIGMLAQWVEEGADEGDPQNLPPVPDWPKGWQLGEPDLVVTMTEPFELPADGGDVFRNFVIPVKIPATRYVEAIEFRPGNQKIVHHATIRVDTTHSSRRLDENDPQPGYGGMESGSNAHFPNGHFLGWTAGKVPHRNEPGLSWPLERGTDLVLELHLQPTGKPETLQSSIGLFFTDQPPTKHSFSLVLESREMNIPPGDDAYEVVDEYVLPSQAEILGVYPHAHYLGKTIEGYSVLPDGTKKWLIRIPDWDFNWQDEYRFVEPVSLPKGSRVVMRVTYDNSAENVRNPNHPPQRVVFGPRTNNEMADLVLRTVVPTAVDLATLNQQFGVRGYQKQLDGAKVELAVNPEDAGAWYRKGVSLAKLGDNSEALKCFKRAIELDPHDVRFHNNLGVLLQHSGNANAAKAWFLKALEIRPRNEDVLRNLGLMLQGQGDTSGAIDYFERALEVDPEDMEIANNLAWLLATTDDPNYRNGKDAVHWAEQVSKASHHQKPEYLDTLAAAYAQAGRFSEAVHWQTRAIELIAAPLKPDYQSRLDIYQRRKPYRDGAF